MQIANRRARKRATLLIFVEDVFVKKSPANKRIHLENSPNNMMRLNWLVSGLFRKWGSTHCHASFVNEPSLFDSSTFGQIVEAQANCQGSYKSLAPHRANTNQKTNGRKLKTTWKRKTDRSGHIDCMHIECTKMRHIVIVQTQTDLEYAHICICMYMCIYI